MYHTFVAAYRFDALMRTGKHSFGIVIKSYPLRAKAHPCIQAFFETGIGRIQCKSIKEKIGELLILLRLRHIREQDQNKYSTKYFFSHLNIVTDPVIGGALKLSG